MKNLWAIIFVLLILVVLGMLLFSFRVRETEIALVMTFGKPTATKIDPGWYFKWPPPVNVVYRFDGRSHIYETVLEETTTKGGDPIDVTSYIIWKIGDPQKFRESVQDVGNAEDKLDTLVRNTQNTVIGQYYFSDFVNSDVNKIKFEQIESQMAEDMKAHAWEDFGIDIKVVGIRQLGISEDATKQVFERMKADRQRKTAKIINDGTTEAGKIKEDAELKRKELLAIVEAEAKAIRGRGDADAAQYYKMLDENPELAMFLRDIEALRKILEDKTTIVIGAETDPIGLLKEAPDIKPTN